VIAGIPDGPAWGIAVLLAMLLKDTIRALVQRRNGATNGASSGKIGERLATLETKVSMLNGAGANLVASRLAALEVTIGSNTEEIGRIRDWKHDELQQQLQRTEARLANLELDMRDRGREP
jgi:hypothetical protein